MQRVLYPLDGDVEILGFLLDADELATDVRTGHAGCAGTHEGIDNGPLLKLPDKILH